MTALAAALLLSQSSPNAAFAAMSTALAPAAVTAHVSVKSVTKSTKVFTTFDLATSGDAVLLRIQEPAKPGLDKTDRSYLLKGTHLIAYDARANEWLDRKELEGKDRYARMRVALGDVPEPVAVMLSAAQAKLFVTRFQKLGKWSVKNLAADTGLTRTTIDAIMSFTLDAKNRLKALRLRGANSSLDWTISYGEPKTISLAVPRDARHVVSFTVMESPPTFGNKETESLYKKMVSTASQLKSATVRIDTGESNIRMAFEGRKVREEQDRVTWVYDGHTLSVYRRDMKKFYRGKVNRPDALDALVALGVAVDPFSKAALLGLVPLKGMFGAGDHVSIAGNLVVNGAPSVILRGVSARRIVSLVLRRDIFLPASVSTEFKDAAGHTLSYGSRSFQFYLLNQDQPDPQFNLSAPPGIAVQPLPKT